MACDGDIAPKELEFIRSYVSNNELFSVVDVENKLNEYVADINQQGISFLNDYLKDIANMSLTETQELNIVRIAIQMIEVDNKIEYSEISFFKRIRPVSYTHLHETNFYHSYLYISMYCKALFKNR